MPQEKTQKPEKNRENEPKKTTEASLKANEKAQENTKKALQKKPRGTFHALGATSVGDEVLSMTTLGPTFTSADGETSITGGYMGISEQPDPNIRRVNRDAVGVTVSTTPGAIKRGLGTVGSKIKKLFSRKQK